MHNVENFLTGTTCLFGSSSRDPIPFKNGTTIKTQELNIFTVCETVLLAPVCRSSNVALAPNFYHIIMYTFC
jgi:hypothetical protein